MSTNHTPNYNLSQWEADDQVLRTEFNSDNAKIDAALGALSAAEEERAGTLAEHTAAIAKLGNCAVWTTSYRGNGTASVTITCPHPPVFVFVRCQTNGMNLILVRGVSYAYVNNSGNTVTVVPNWSGNTVTWREYNNDKNLAVGILNRSGDSYGALVLMDVSM